MSGLAEMAHMVNAASSALEKLSGSHGRCGNSRRKFLRSIYASINQARLRDVSMQEIAKSISASTGMTVSVDSLYYYLRKLREEEEAAAKKISRTIAEAKSECGAGKKP